MTVSIQRVRPGLGSWIAIRCEAADAAAARRALEAGYASVERVDATLHPTRAGSDLAAIRIAAVGEPVAIDPWTRAIVALSQRLHRMTAGAFDPCPPIERGRIVDLELRSEGAVKRSPLVVDLGGIAKGFAVDRAVDAMRANGARSGLVNAGGDVRAFGGSEFVVWIVAKRGARPIRLVERACAVSDPLAIGRPSEHLGYYRLGATASGVGSAVAITAPSAALADALTTCAVRGVDTCLRDAFALCDAEQLEW